MFPNTKIRWLLVSFLALCLLALPSFAAFEVPKLKTRILDQANLIDAASEQQINQLLAGLAFLVITFWLRRRGLPYSLALIPGILMLVLPAIAMSLNLRDFADNNSWLLFGFGFTTIIIEVWMIVEALSVWKKSKGILEIREDIPKAAENRGGRSC